jgi:hypothetical protein
MILTIGTNGKLNRSSYSRASLFDIKLIPRQFMQHDNRPETFLVNNRERDDQSYVKESAGIGQGFEVVDGLRCCQRPPLWDQESVNNPSH